MRRPARNLLYAALGVLCSALLLQGIGLQLPGVLKILTAVKAVALSSPVVVQSRAEPSGAAAAGYLTETACTASSSIETRFNSTPIAEGNFIWFNSAVRVNRLGADAATIFLKDSRITFAANGSNYILAVPAAMITFDPAATSATTSFDNRNDRWTTIVPSGLSRKVFLSGLAFSVPAGGLPGGISSVTWSAAFSTVTPGVTVQWGWGAAVYTTFATDYNALAIKPVDDGQPSQGARTLAANPKNHEYDSGRVGSVGRPAVLEAFVTGGAGGDRGSNLTRSFGVMSNVTPCAAGSSAPPRSSTLTTIALADRSSTGIEQIRLELVMTKTCPSVEPPGASFQCTFTIQNQDPDNTVIDLAVTNTVPFPGGTPVPAPCEFPTGTPVTTLQPFGTPGDTCIGVIVETAPDCSPTGLNLLADLVAATGFNTNSGGEPIPVSGVVNNSVQILDCPPTPTNTPTSTPTNTPTNTPTSTPTNTPAVGNQGCGPGYWKNHTGAWQGYSPNQKVTTVFDTNQCGCDFSDVTLLQALRLASGSTICDAEGKLLQMGVAALLNASSGIGYPLTTAQITDEVNAVIASCGRTTILAEASRLDAFNNSGCPLH